MFVFVYGTLKRGHGNHRLLRDAMYQGTGRIEGFKMYNLLGGFPGIIPGEGVAHGEFYEIRDDDEPTLESLDWLEGVNHKNPRNGMYRRERVTVLTDQPYPDASISAWVYVYNGSVSERDLVENGKWR